MAVYLLARVGRERKYRARPRGAWEWAKRSAVEWFLVEAGSAAEGRELIRHWPQSATLVPADGDAPARVLAHGRN